MALIEFVDVSKVYPGSLEPAVERLHLAIEKGEFISLLGPSGSGKTTCLMMLAGFEPVSAGTIRLGGRPIEQLPAHRRNMGVVFQSYSLFPHLTVAGNVAFPLQMRKRPAAEIGARVQQALARVRLEAYAGRRPSQLSGGQQQRVALARALVFEPSLVLMDEPLAALDKKLREEMQLEIRRLHRELGVTMVYVTHDQSEAMTLSDRVAVFNRGRIEQMGAPSELYDRPAGTFVAGFVGDNNAVRGRVAGIDAASRHARIEVPGIAAPMAGRLGVHGSGALAAEATLCVRPERLRVAADGPWPATVVDLIHQGDHWRLIAQLDGTQGAATPPPWVVKLAAGAMPEGLSPGAGIRLAFGADDAWVF
jgi:putative spermidine/putrescine transport system ATP-binding protein